MQISLLDIIKSLDNYFISLNTIDNLSILFKQYDFIVGQIKDNNGRFREYSSKRVQGTTFAIKKKILTAVNGFGEWTEDFSCGVDSDIWIKIYDYFNKNKQLKACYTNQISTYDSHSKRWGKFTKIFKEWYIQAEKKVSEPNAFALSTGVLGSIPCPKLTM